MKWEFVVLAVAVLLVGALGDFGAGTLVSSDVASQVFGAGCPDKSKETTACSRFSTPSCNGCYTCFWSQRVVSTESGASKGYVSELLPCQAGTICQEMQLAKSCS